MTRLVTELDTWLTTVMPVLFTEGSTLSDSSPSRHFPVPIPHPQPRGSPSTVVLGLTSRLFPVPTSSGFSSSVPVPVSTCEVPRTGPVEHCGLTIYWTHNGYSDVVTPPSVVTWPLFFHPKITLVQSLFRSLKGGGLWSRRLSPVDHKPVDSWKPQSKTP